MINTKLERVFNVHMPAWANQVQKSNSDDAIGSDFEAAIVLGPFEFELS
jgi:hypothetical protein